MRAQCRLLGGPRHLPIPSAMLSPLMHTPLQTAPSSSTNRTPAIDTAARADATQALLVGGGDDAVKQTDLTIAEQGCRPLTVPPEDVCWYVRVTIHLQGAPPSQAVCFGGPVERRSANGNTERLFLSLLERRDGESIGFRDSRTSRRALAGLRMPHAVLCPSQTAPSATCQSGESGYPTASSNEMRTLLLSNTEPRDMSKKAIWGAQEALLESPLFPSCVHVLSKQFG